MQAIATARDSSMHGILPQPSASEENALCRRWHDHHDVAMMHSDFGVLMQELIGEGYVSLMRAACRYDPACGTRFSTYATRWVQAAIQQSVLRAAPTIQAGTTGAEIGMPPVYTRIGGQNASARFAS